MIPHTFYAQTRKDTVRRSPQEGTAPTVTFQRHMRGVAQKTSSFRILYHMGLNNQVQRDKKPIVIFLTHPQSNAICSIFQESVSPCGHSFMHFPHDLQNCAAAPPVQTRHMRTKNGSFFLLIMYSLYAANTPGMSTPNGQSMQ